MEQKIEKKVFTYHCMETHQHSPLFYDSNSKQSDSNSTSYDFFYFDIIYLTIVSSDITQIIQVKLINSLNLANCYTLNVMGQIYVKRFAQNKLPIMTGEPKCLKCSRRTNATSCSAQSPLKMWTILLQT